MNWGDVFVEKSLTKTLLMEMDLHYCIKKVHNFIHTNSPILYNIWVIKMVIISYNNGIFELKRSSGVNTS